MMLRGEVGAYEALAGMGGNEGQVNRFAIALVAMVVLFAALLVVALAWLEPDGSIARLQQGVDFLDNHRDRDGRIILTLISVVVILLILTVLIVQLAPTSSGRMSVRNMKSGSANITTAEIASAIDAGVATIAHVAACEASVTRRGKKVDVVLDLHVDPGADLAHTADEACRHAHVLVEQELGIELAAMPRARLHYRELRLGLDDASQRTGWERPPSEERQ
jgi:hypothetical protein